MFLDFLFEGMNAFLGEWKGEGEVICTAFSKAISRKFQKQFVRI